ILEVSNTASVVLKVDPTVILATQQQVEAAEARAKAYTDREVAEVSQALDAHKAAAAPHSGHETPAGAKAKAEAAAGAVQAELDVHLADNTNPHNVTKSQVGLSKVENMSATEIRTATNRSLKVEVISSSGSVTPEQGRIIFDASKKKFFGGTGSEWV